MAQQIQLKNEKGKVYPNPFWPIGSIYISVSSENPSIYFGGTWVQFGQGKTLVGVNTSEAEFNTVQKTGGSKTVALTTAQMPAHNHGSKSLVGTLKTYIYQTFVSSGIVSQDKDTMNKNGGSGGTTWGGATYEIDASHTHNTEGAGQAHNNLQPYITVYFWRRTA